LFVKAQPGVAPSQTLFHSVGLNPFMQFILKSTANPTQNSLKIRIIDRSTCCDTVYLKRPGCPGP
jgi:hypothetical protein